MSCKYANTWIVEMAEMVSQICVKMAETTATDPQEWADILFPAFYDIMLKIYIRVEYVCDSERESYQNQCLELEGQMIDAIRGHGLELTHDRACTLSYAYTIVSEAKFTQALSLRSRFAHIKPAQ